MQKREQYRKVLKRLESQIANERDWLANLSNSAQLFGKLIDDLNWIGFYLHRNDELVLGPFWGNPAVSRISMGKGVCGTSAEKGETIIVPNVHEFPGHIVCDIISQSEIVVPIFDGDRLLGVLDVDSPTLERFDDEDKKGLEEILKVLVEGTDWQGLN
ncbi:MULTISPECIES: GAF domain-containing protein [unclassified Fusibacter]|uniref:GAF domain-containing protein n=1 Tax=unclassified Fusibacter TaxID=2624464 RepID=UPI001011F552|nr:MULTISPECIES: GAF domain-containing protein [unclassified Fusibacter]MCK8059976.1 GAF domain-containing protein [Fusibacter sp. A2]NPE22116.1 GAF domain-containing protein [Fusibacter sp. A1]RXV60894.1 GAF domain-containing protein [Fusibacter sp. A1]